MKKFALIVCTVSFLAVGGLSANASENAENCIKKVPSQEQIQIRKARELAFEQKLGLTDEQKAKAKEIRLEGRKKIKPIMDEIKAKKQEAEAIKKSRMAVQMQEEKLIVIDKELVELQKKANEIRKQNMKDFEAILTRAQKRTLNKMKKEGRKNFENNRKG